MDLYFVRYVGEMGELGHGEGVMVWMFVLLVLVLCGL